MDTESSSKSSDKIIVDYAEEALERNSNYLFVILAYYAKTEEDQRKYGDNRIK